MPDHDIVAEFTAEVDGTAYDVRYGGDYDDGLPTNDYAMWNVNLLRVAGPDGLMHAEDGDGDDIQHAHPRLWQILQELATADMMQRIMLPVPANLTPMVVRPGCTLHLSRPANA